MSVTESPADLSANTAVGNYTTTDRAHPLALQAWAVLCDRAEADQRLVFDACRRRRRVATTEDQAVALHALERCRAEIDGTLTRRKYDAFRDSREGRKSWPTVRFIRDAFGTWAQAMEATGEPVPDATTVRLTAKGRRFTAEEIVKLAQRWAQTASRPLEEGAFVRWCISEDDAGRRAPRSVATIWTTSVASEN